MPDGRLTLWESAKELLLEQYKGSPKFVGLLQAAIEEAAQPLVDASADLKDALDLETATGKLLDIIGKMVDVHRGYGETDESMRARIDVAANNEKDGTPDGVIEAAKALSGDAAPQYIEEAPATFFVYTPNGTQLKRKQVKKLAPAGVLGLPGAAIRLGNGKLLKCHNGKTFLVAALDYKRRMTALLVDDEGNELVDENRNPLLAVLD